MAIFYLVWEMPGTGFTEPGSMGTHLKINYIELPAENIELAKSFYGAAFGWSFEDYGPDYCAFNDGDNEGGFYRSPMCSNSTEGAALVVLYAEDIAAAEAAVLESGGAIKTPVFSFPGGKRFHFLDPNQNELAVWSDQ